MKKIQLTMITVVLVLSGFSAALASAANSRLTIDINVDALCSHNTYATAGSQNDPSCPTFNPFVAQVTNTTDGQPVIDGVFDAIHSSNLQIQINGNTYILGSSAELTSPAGTNYWKLDLSSLSPALAPGNYAIIVTMTDSGGTSFVGTDTIVIPPEQVPVTDVCLNIGGIQATVPAGMVVDGSGNCSTPVVTPPVTPPVTTVDMCYNLAGTQAVIPAGYYRTSGGNCYIQPTPPADPIDVCSNLDGVQEIVPDGYVNDTDGNCTQPVADACSNIDGIQEEVPDGMSTDSYNNCFTPYVPGDTEVTPPSGKGDGVRQPAGIGSVPEILRPLATTIANLIPEAGQKWLRELPENAARVVPYYVFIMVAILALIPIFQAIREAQFARILATLLKRERDIAEQKDNFIALASHYLRTPITLMKSGLDTIVSLKELPEDSIQGLRAPLQSLEANVNQVLSDVESNAALNGISAPPADEKIPPVWRSGWFWGPIIGSIALTLIANFLLVVVGGKNVGITDTFFHFLVASIAFLVLYLGVRNLYLKRKLHRYHQDLINHEKTIDEARNRFIADTTTTLQNHLEPIDKSRSVIDNAPSVRFFNEGYERLNSVLGKFFLLTQVQTGIGRNIETFNLRDMVNQVIVSHQGAIAARSITIANEIQETVAIRQNKNLFSFVIGALLDNAIKFNRDGGNIVISAKPSDKTVSVQFTDNGIGIDQAKLDQLFKPFSRATSSIEFNYEGMGFSLFLSKIIMDYTNGAISANSVENQGTDMAITTDLAAATSSIS